MTTGIAQANFCCPECGAGLRLPRRDAGMVIGCHCCGEAIRIPRQPHPVECDVTSDSLISVETARSAEAGLRRLSLSLMLNLSGWLCAAAVALAWVIVEGPAAVYHRNSGEMRSWLIAAALTNITLAFVTAALRLRGYRQTRPAAELLRGGQWLGTAMIGVGVSTIGLLLAVTPPLFGFDVDATPSLLLALVELGRLAVVTGLVLEMAVMFVWSRLLTELLDRDEARRVVRYGYTLLIGGLATTMTLCLSGMIVIMAVRRSTPETRHPAPAPKPDFTLVPDSVWSITLMVFAVAFVTVLLLCGQYLRMLQVLRTAFRNQSEA